jgi:hypothetical protein
MLVTVQLVAVVIGLLSIAPVINMLSPQQVMNTSSEPLCLVNSYGTFGAVGKERMNVVFEGAASAVPSDSTGWKPYPYKGLPVDPAKSPPQIAPYQLRLDWQMWFASMATPADYPWGYTLASNLLHNDGGREPFCSQPIRRPTATFYRGRVIPLPVCAIGP